MVHELASVLDSNALACLQNRQQNKLNIFGKDIILQPTSSFEWEPDYNSLNKLCDLDKFFNTDKYLDNFTIKYEGSLAKDEKAKTTVKIHNVRISILNFFSH